MNFVKILVISLFLITGCATAPKFKSCEKTKLNIQELDPLKMKKVRFFIVTKDNADQVFKELEEMKHVAVLFGLTGTSYQNLSLNLAEIRSFLVKQRKIIKSYKQYYE